MAEAAHDPIVDPEPRALDRDLDGDAAELRLA
jgi:hypothetical protein